MARKRGFAINAERTETGLTAIAVPVGGPESPPIAAVALALPSARFQRDQIPEWVSALSDTAAAINRGTVEARTAG
jgi:DNA-binding IclR family transcriptional regulator